MKRLIALILGLLVAVPALATDYYLGSTGNNSAAGTSYATRWRTMAKADSTLRPGDVLHVYNGSYTMFNPDSAGSNPTGGGRITLVGANLSADPLTSSSARDLITLTTSDITKSYLSIKGVRLAGQTTLVTPAKFDSIAFCHLTGTLDIDGADHCWVTQNSCTGDRIKIGHETIGASACDTVTYNDFPNLTSVGSVESVVQFGANGGQYVDSCYYAFNTHVTTMDPSFGDVHPLILFQIKRSTLYGNKWRDYLNNTSQVDGQYVLRMRDSCYRNVLRRDTLIATGNYGKIFWSSDGKSTAAWKNSVFENTIDSCFINLSGCTGMSRTYFDQGMHSDTFTYNTIIANGDNDYSPFHVDYVSGRSVIDHNTFVGRSSYNGVVRFRDPFQHFWNAYWPDTAVTFTNNIIYSVGPGLQNDPANPYTGSPNLGSQQCGLYFEKPAIIDSAGLHHRQTKFVSNNNLYAYYGWWVTPGDRSLLMFDAANGVAMVSPPGDSTSTNVGHFGLSGAKGSWEGRFGTDSLSRYGDPRFADSSMASFNPMPLSLSAAIGHASDGGDIGSTRHSSDGDTPISWMPTSIIFQQGRADSVLITLWATGPDTVAVNWSPNAWHSSITGYPKSCELGQYGITFEDCNHGTSIGPGLSYSQKVYYDGIGPLLNTTISIVTFRGFGLPEVPYSTTGDGDPHAVIRIPLTIH